MSGHAIRKSNMNETESERGQSYAEYSLMLSFVVVSVVVTVVAFGLALRTNLLEPVNEQIAQSVAPCNVAASC